MLRQSRRVGYIAWNGRGPSQHAIVEALVARTRDALEREPVERLAIGGGVAANTQLRERVAELAAERGARVWIPDFSLCTDNAAMIAGAARFAEPIAYPGYLALDASARLEAAA
jgi:N6-L-threonylcarbamoyladenine synthase